MPGDGSRKYGRAVGEKRPKAAMESFKVSIYSVQALVQLYIKSCSPHNYPYFPNEGSSKWWAQPALNPEKSGQI